MTHQQMTRLCTTIVTLIALPIALILTIIQMTNRDEDARLSQPIVEPVVEPVVEPEVIFGVKPHVELTRLACLPWNDLRRYAKVNFGLTTNNKAKLLTELAQLID